MIILKGINKIIGIKLELVVIYLVLMIYGYTRASAIRRVTSDIRCKLIRL